MEVALREELISIVPRIYPLNAPERPTTPYMIYVSSEGLQDKSLLGYESSKVVQLELNIIDKRFGDVKELTAAVISKIQSFEQRAIGSNGPYVNEIAYDDPVYLHEHEVDLYRCVISLRIYL